MRCGKTHLIEIRNFEDFSIEPAGNMTVLTGKNGAGKTNIIEAIYFASVGKSFRTSNDEELIRLNKEEGTILLDFSVRGVTHEIKIKLSRNKGKKILINETATKKRELMGMFRTVLFTPDELQLIKGAPQNRRRFIDLEISQVSPRYYEEILRYGRAVQQRNAAFKEARFHGFMADVDIWDMQIAKRASYIVKKRMETIEKMNEIVSSMESFLTDEMIPVTPEYGPEIIAMNELADIYSLSIHFLNCSNVTVGVWPSGSSFLNFIFKSKLERQYWIMAYSFPSSLGTTNFR